MPGRDGTGPLGLGGMTGRGLGFCSGAGSGRFGSGFGAGYGRGLGTRFGYGCRRGRFFNIAPSESMEQEILSAERDYLEARLNTIKEHLDRTKASDK
ncbi:MAG: DUF5320 domain-containing protein [Eubacteriales bacterium]|nr:DUF5320 domain-containing protein [Eubacteriales bacterium]